VKDDRRQSLGNLLWPHVLRHGEDFRHTILSAIGLLIFVRVKTFHAASPHFRPCPGAIGRLGAGGTLPLGKVEDNLTNERLTHLLNAVRIGAILPLV
jgi:hypothetical protein